uniref:Uncharacterized protein n=1 Tax=Myoviridae sp. ctZgq1 TaxID=2826666 RepID=A0A8S5LX43_9CAUD|nr:MAG TPA: hypothetical protein [Myoviridae sp. ctZgq1]
MSYTHLWLQYLLHFATLILYHIPLIKENSH